MKKEPNDEDLHTGKDSHASLPIAHDMEFHVRNEELTHEFKTGDQVCIIVPGEVTSKDEDMTRFKQTSPVKFEPRVEVKHIHLASMPLNDLKDKLKEASEER